MLSHSAVAPICAVPSSNLVTVNMTKKTKVKRDVVWQQRGLTKGKRAPNELLLRQSLRRIFPNEEIIFKARKALNITTKEEGTRHKYLEIDASIPRLKFHIEYQDPYHYTSIYYSNRPLADIQAIDAFKKKIISERGESLLQLPCWWDGTDESLVATIKSMRPDLLPHRSSSSKPVPEAEPHDFLQYDFVPDVGPLMRPVFFTKNYYKQQGSIWLGNEKLDGVRCCWNYNKQKLYSRSGNELRFPEECKQHMPDSLLDGEVWFGRGQFHEAAKLGTLRTSAINWPLFRISVFDIAGTGSTQMNYNNRYNKLQSMIPYDHPFLFIPSTWHIHSEEQRLNFEKHIAINGGEGVILTEKNSLYERGHTSKVLKVKPSLDKEALVISSDGEHLTLELTDGTRFRTHTPNIQPLPRVGDVITFTYIRCVQGSTLPEKPQIYRVRTDVTWSEVVASVNEGSPLIDVGRDYSTRWDRDLDDLKGYFTKFARNNNFDPLVSANWYNVQRQDILSLPGAINMLKGFNGSVVNALVASFPDIGLDKSMFSIVPRGYWQTHNVKKWFDEFAGQKRFNPLVAQNWYSITRIDVVSKKGGQSILNRFNGSHINAIVAAYPDVGLDESMFSTPPWGHWNIQNVRKWFAEFSNSKGFDPSVPQNWYNVTRADVLNKTGGQNILYRFNGSHINAIVAAYPDIGLDESMFSVVSIGHWKDIQNVRKWFAEFTERKGFDPFVAQNWYTVTRADVLNKKGGQSILQHFNNSHINAIVAAYPNIGLDKSLFSVVPKGHWKDIQNVRKWFDGFAKQQGFDPLVAQNWYSITRIDVVSKKGRSILQQFNSSHINAIVAAYPDIGLDKAMFATTLWGNCDHQNVRKWFDELSNSKGFNPLVPQNWYTVTRTEVINNKGGLSILRHFNNSHINAIAAAYPDIGLDESMFSTPPWGHWKNIQNVRKWFDELANSKGFDSLVPQNWYNVTRADVLNKTGGQNILYRFNGSHINAIVAAYPDIGLDESMFSVVPKGHWKDIQNVRKWFDGFAKQQGFDPLVAQNWYSITRIDVVSKKGGQSILNRFNGSHINAIAAAYPSIVFN